MSTTVMTERRRPLENDDGQGALFGGEAFAPSGPAPAWNRPTRQETPSPAGADAPPFEASVTGPRGSDPPAIEASVETDLAAAPERFEPAADGTAPGASAPSAFEPAITPGAFEPGPAPEAFEPGSAPEAFEPGSAPEAFEPGPAPETFEPGAAPEPFEPDNDPSGADAAAHDTRVTSPSPFADEIAELERATDARAPRRPRAPLAGPTLDDIMSRAWEGLATGLPAACPVCHGEVVVAAAGPRRGHCSSCGTTIE